MKYSALTLLLLTTVSASAQVYTNKEVGKKNQALADSLKQSEYPYALPIWGAKATALGYNLPYSAGLSTQYLWSESDLVIENLLVGFNGGTQYDLDQLVRFDKAIATVNGVTVRPDVWVLPFLNVYGVFGVNNGSTDVGWGLWLPDSTGTDQQIFRADTKVDFKATTFGLGVTPTIGVGGGWLALDMNFTWSDIPQLDKPAFAFVFGPRMGKTFKMKKPDRNVNLWVGGFRLAIASETSGSLAIGGALPIEQWQSQVDQGVAKVIELDQEVEAWWIGLTPLEQANPVNAARYNAANAALDRAAGFLDAAGNAVGTAESSTVQYSLDKRPADKWNFLIGGQFQYNKHLMLRAEYGFLSSREQLLVGLQYRFGL